MVKPTLLGRKEHDTTKQDKVNKTKARETVSQGPFVGELPPKVLVGKGTFEGG